MAKFEKAIAAHELNKPIRAVITPSTGMASPHKSSFLVGGAGPTLPTLLVWVFVLPMLMPMLLRLKLPLLLASLVTPTRISTMPMTTRVVDIDLPPRLSWPATTKNASDVALSRRCPRDAIGRSTAYTAGATGRPRRSDRLYGRDCSGTG